MADWMRKLLLGLAVVVGLVAIFGLKLVVASLFPPTPEPHTVWGVVLQIGGAILLCVVAVWYLWRK